MGSEDNKVYALNASNGELLWNYMTGDMVISRPAVAQGVVYVGSWDGKLYALNAADGSYVWSYATGGEIDSSPTVAAGLVYVGSHDGVVYALNASTGMVGFNLELHNNVVWSYATGGMIMFSSPAVADGVVYVGSYDDNVYALNATTGALHLELQNGRSSDFFSLSE